MSEHHDHGHAPQTFRYTVYLRHWWGCSLLVVNATGSNKNGDELLLYEADGTLHSINYRHVLRLVAEPVNE